jgi:hypothetical protein
MRLSNKQSYSSNTKQRQTSLKIGGNTSALYIYIYEDSKSGGLKARETYNRNWNKNHNNRARQGWARRAGMKKKKRNYGEASDGYTSLFVCSYSCGY